MKLLILGATGKTGNPLVEQALAAGHTVTVLVRDATQMTAQPNLDIQVGNARDTAAMTAALRNQDAVISALGSNKLGDDLITATTAVLIDAMQITNVRRIILLSSFLVTPNAQRGWIGGLIKRLTHGITKDKISGETVLKQSDLDWTIVYATRLDGAPAGQTVRIVAADEAAKLTNGIARADVATYMLQQLNKLDSIHTTRIITSR